MEALPPQRLGVYAARRPSFDDPPPRLSRESTLDIHHSLPAPAFTEGERNFGRLIKICCLVIIALAVIYGAMERLKGILIPFMLALALTYLLSPLIDCLSCRHHTDEECARKAAAASRPRAGQNEKLHIPNRVRDG